MTQQSFHRGADEKVNDAVTRIQQSMKVATLDPSHAVSGGPGPQPVSEMYYVKILGFRYRPLT